MSKSSSKANRETGGAERDRGRDTESEIKNRKRGKERRREDERSWKRRGVRAARSLFQRRGNAWPCII